MYEQTAIERDYNLCYNRVRQALRSNQKCMK